MNTGKYHIALTIVIYKNTEGKYYLCVKELILMIGMDRKARKFSNSP